jgi:hypothetical protein
VKKDEMPEDKEVEAGQETEAPSEGETGDPSPEPEAQEEQEGQDGAEDETPQERRKDFRDDVYRIARAAEKTARENASKLDSFMAEFRASKTQADDKSDPVKQRAALATDPLRVIRETAQEEARVIAREEAQKSAQETRVRESRDLLLKDFPELKNTSHPFYSIVEEEYQLLLAEGNQGPGLPRLAAKLAAERRPELRDQGMKDTRKKAVENGTRKVAATTKVEGGVTKPKASDPTSGLSKKDHEIARRFGVNLSDEKQRAKFLKFRESDQKALIGGYPKPDED